MFKIALFSGGFLLCYLLSGCTFVNSIIGPKDIQQDFEKISDISLPDINAADIIPTTDGRLIASGLVVVVFKEDVSLKTKKEAIDQWGGQLVGQIPQINTYYVKFLDLHTENKINQIIKQLSLDPTVAAVLPEYFEKLEEQSFIDSITDIESLDSPSKKWGFVKIQAPEAWSLLREGRINLSDNIVVGVIDTSFDLHHEELRQNFVMTLNGYPVHDFGDNDPDVSPDEIDPTYQNHGTFVAGIIASSINKNEINGVAPTVKIFPLKHSSHKWCFKPDTPPKIHFRCGKFTNAWIAAVVYAADAGVDVINMSFGGLLPKRCDYYNWENDPRYKAIRYAREKGIMLIASAGNENADAVRNYPSCFKEVIAVGATNQNDERGVPAVPSWIGSNFSDEEDALWVAAPGVAIYSTASTKEKYKSDSGTSFAAPFVSGLAALLKQIKSTLSASDIEQILRDTADTISVSYPDGTKHNWKRINVYKAVKKVVGKNERRDKVTVCHQNGDYNSIQAAIDAVEPGMTIEICPGQYNENLVIKKSLQLKGLEKNQTIIRGALDGWPIIRVEGPKAQITIEGLTVSYAKGQSCFLEAPQWVCPSGIQALGETTVNLINIQSMRNGSAGLAVFGSASVSVSRSRIFENYAGAVIGENAKVVMENTEIFKNISDRGWGIFTSDSTVVQIKNSSIYENAVGIGSYGSTILTLEHSIVEKNGIHADCSGEKPKWSCSGIVLAQKSSTTIKNSTIRNNISYGIVSVLKKCNISDDYIKEYKFTGTLTIIESQVYSNTVENICIPQDLQGG